MASLAKKCPELLMKGHTYCPGCGHGIFIRVLLEVLEEKNLLEKNICAVGVGCSATFLMMQNGANTIETHHGRAPVVARAMKALMPDTFLWTYQGDGDAYAIGMGETILAEQYSVGMNIEHKHFGKCTILDIDGDVATIRLENQDIKKIMLSMSIKMKFI